MIVVYLDVPEFGMGDIGFAQKLANAVKKRYPRQNVVKVYSIKSLDDPRVDMLEGSGFVSYERFIKNEPVDLLLEGPVYDRTKLDKFITPGRKLPHIKLSEYSFSSSSSIGRQKALATVAYVLRTGLADDELGVLLDDAGPREEKASDEDTLPELDIPLCGFSYGVTAVGSGGDQLRDRYRYCRDHMLYTQLRLPQQRVHVRLDFNITMPLLKDMMSAAMNDKVLGHIYRFNSSRRRHGGTKRNISVVDLTRALSQTSTYTDVFQAINAEVDRVSRIPKKHYVSFVLPRLNTDVFKKLQLSAGDLVFVTGDQSFVEALQAGKIVSYECQSWKMALLKNYLKQMKRCLSADAYRLVELLNKQNVDFYTFTYRDELSALFLRRDLLEEIKRENRRFVEAKDLAKNVFRITDKLMLPVKVRMQLLHIDCWVLYKERIRGFLDQIDQTCPQHSLRACGLFSAKNRARVDAFLLKARIHCASGSIRPSDLPQLICDDLQELVTDLITEGSQRTIECIMQAADQTLLHSIHPVASSGELGVG